MAKKKSTKLGASNQQFQTNETRVPAYERLRLQRMAENDLRLQALGLHEKARSLTGQYQIKQGNSGKKNKTKDAEEDEIYRPYEPSENEHDSSDEEICIKETLSNQGSNYNRKKIRKVKVLSQKAVTTALAYKTRRQKLNLVSSHGGSSTPNHSLQQPNLTGRESVEMLEAEVEHLNQKEDDKENGENDKPRRGPTMCYKVHGRNEDERLEITLNEYGQAIGPDDKTCNEFISFLGTIGRKANILPLTVKSWPILRNEKKEELWKYVLKHYIVPIEAKEWVVRSIGAAWRRYKCYLKRNHFDRYADDKVRMKERPKRVPKTMFKDLLRIWNDKTYQDKCKKNKANRLVGKEKNIMHTSGPRSFARVRHKLKKDNKTTQNPSLAQMFIETRKEKLTKRKPGDLRDKLIDELKNIDSEEDVESVISSIVGTNNKKKSRLNFYGRGVSSIQLKQKALMKEVEEKHAQEVVSLQKDYEHKRQQDKREIANGLSSFISQLQQQNPELSFDLSMFGSLFLDNQEKNSNTTGVLRLHSSPSTSKGDLEDEQEEEDEEDNE